VIASHVWTAAERAAGAIIVLGVPPMTPTQQYIGARLTLGGTTPSVTATISLQPQKAIDSWIAYAKSYVV
jgi:hypothetical protein